MNAEQQKQMQEQRAKEIARGVNWLGAATIGLFVVTVAIAVVGFVILRREISRNETARQALCAQRHDLDQRISATAALLKEHRGDKLIFSIPRSLIVAGFYRDQTTRRNLEILDCKGGSP